MCVSPNQQFLSFGRNQVTIIQVPQFTILAHFTHEEKGARSSSLTDNVYISGDYSGTISIFQLSNMQGPPAMINSHTAQINSLILSKDQSKIISGSSDRTVQVIDLQEKVLVNASWTQIECSVMGLSLFNSEERLALLRRDSSI